MGDAVATAVGSAARISDMDRQLNSLWAQVAGSQEAALRATTLTLIVHTSALDRAMQVISRVPGSHPCRMIVIDAGHPASVPLSATPSIWCQVGFGQEQRSQVCGEQIVINAGADSAERIPAAVQSLLIPDQPVYLYWQDDFSPSDPLFVGVKDTLTGLVVDSAAFTQPEQGLRGLQALLETRQFDGALFDLNWQRLTYWCAALASEFDMPEDLEALYTAQSVEVVYAGNRETPLLFLGWLADRVGWQVSRGPDPETWIGRSERTQATLKLTLVPDHTPGIHQIVIQTPNCRYSLDYAEADQRLVARSDGRTGIRASAPPDPGDLLNTVLNQIHSGAVYERALLLTMKIVTEIDSLGQRATLVVLENAIELCQTAARDFVKASQTAVSRAGRFSVALSGGTTPRALYEMLARPPYRDQIPWTLTDIFWGDERAVPVYHPDSNQRMAREALLSLVPIPEDNIHAIRTGQGSEEEIAARYAADIRKYFNLAPGVLPRFDLILLGLGDDGHTASLFPHTSALTARGDLLFVANPVPQLNTIRLTLTYDAINNARAVVFLISGEKKADILYEVMRGLYQPDEHPSQRINPINGTLTILADAAAVSKLPR